MTGTPPRYAPGRAFPPYAHRLGRTPHPRNDPDGHSYGAPEPGPADRLTTTGWAANEIYCFGFDLYNHGYWWEAHEEWEGLWLLEEEDGPARQFLQGLIQVSAAMAKWEQGNRRGVEGLGSRGLARLRAAAEAGGPVFLGLEVGALVRDLQVFFARLGEGGPPPQPPPMRLASRVAG